MQEGKGAVVLIEISVGKDHISVKGHAEYAERGWDIVCAAVSALTQNLVDSIESLTEDTIEHDISIGDVDIHYWDLSEK